MRRLRTVLLLTTLVFVSLNAGAFAQDLEWAELGTGSDFAWGRGMASFADGSSVIMGEFRADVTFGSVTLNSPVSSFSVFIVRYNADGTVAWARLVSGNSRAGGVSAFADGSSVITGGIDGSVTFGAGEANETTLVGTGASDVFVARYNADGTLAWAVQKIN